MIAPFVKGTYKSQLHYEEWNQARLMERGAQSASGRAAVLDAIRRTQAAHWRDPLTVPVSASSISDNDALFATQIECSQRVLRFWYDWRQQQWQRAAITVSLPDPLPSEPFSSGRMRDAFVFYNLSAPRGARKWVMKRVKSSIIDSGVADQSLYFKDAMMQAACAYLADEYNARGPPKRIEFIESSIMEVGGALYAIEPFLDGKYTKYSNNAGWVLSGPESRNTPHAFSHFTYNYTAGECMVVDMQGVGDQYTDPQCHTVHRRNTFGLGDRGKQGQLEALRTHRCNPICRFLGLSDPKEPLAVATGTMADAAGRDGGAGSEDDGASAAAAARPEPQDALALDDAGMALLDQSWKGVNPYGARPRNVGRGGLISGNAWNAHVSTWRKWCPRQDEGGKGGVADAGGTISLETAYALLVVRVRSRGDSLALCPASVTLHDLGHPTPERFVSVAVSTGGREHPFCADGVVTFGEMVAFLSALV